MFTCYLEVDGKLQMKLAGVAVRALATLLVTSARRPSTPSTNQDGNVLSFGALLAGIVSSPQETYKRLWV